MLDYQKNTDKWVKCNIEDIGEVIGGGTPSTTVADYYGKDIAWITPKDLSNYNRKFISRGERGLSIKGLENSSAKLIPKNSILFTSRAPIGYIAIAENELCTNQGFKSIVLNEKMTVPEYLYYFLKFKTKELKEMGTGTTFKEISGSMMKNVKVIIPPLPEQHRIVAKIEELYSELENGVESLKAAQQQLKAYRQAVLKWAFEGKLTEKWRKKEWEWITLGDFAEDIRIGPFGTLLHESDYVQNGIPLINPKHIREQKIYPDQNVTISIKKANELSSYKLQENDVLLARRGEMGRSAHVTEKENGWICGTGSMIIRLGKKNNAKLYNLIFTEKRVKDYLENNCTGTTMSNLNEKIVKNIPVPVIPFQEQSLILSEIESRLSVCDKMEESIKISLLKAEALRQSILKKAFEGRLVPQDPNDEPADKLLAQIRLEREVQQSTPKSSVKKAKGAVK